MSQLNRVKYGSVVEYFPIIQPLTFAFWLQCVSLISLVTIYGFLMGFLFIIINTYLPATGLGSQFLGFYPRFTDWWLVATVGDRFSLEHSLGKGLQSKQGIAHLHQHQLVISSREDMLAFPKTLIRTLFQLNESHRTKLYVKDFITPSKDESVLVWHIDPPSKHNPQSG
jgi:hypothetical protein